MFVLCSRQCCTGAVKLAERTRSGKVGRASLHHSTCKLHKELVILPVRGAQRWPAPHCYGTTHVMAPLDAL